MTKVEPKVAIILPCIGNLQYLKITIKCLFDSTSFPFKLILVESESTDGTADYCDYLAKEKDNVEVYHRPRKGLPEAINFAMEKAGDLDVYITQDDVIHFRLLGRDWLSEMYETAKGKNVGMVTTRGGYGKSGPDNVDGMNWVGTWNMYLSRKVINAVGKFDEKMRAGDDIDYSYRCFKNGLGFAVIEYWTQHHRFTEHSPGDTSKVQKEMAKYWRNKYKDELKVIKEKGIDSLMNSKNVFEARKKEVQKDE